MLFAADSDYNVICLYFNFIEGKSSHYDLDTPGYTRVTGVITKVIEIERFKQIPKNYHGSDC